MLCALLLVAASIATPLPTGLADEIHRISATNRMELSGDPAYRAFQGGGGLVRARAVHAGYPVWGADITLGLAPDGSVDEVRVRPHPPLPLLAVPPPEGPGDLMWRDVSGSWRLVRMVRPNDPIRGNIEVRDAFSGEVLDGWPNMRQVTAPARVYDFAPSDGDLIDVTLESLDDDDSLVGDHFVVGEATSSGGMSAIYSDDGEFMFDEDDDEFAGVMAYHHLTSTRKRAKALSSEIELDDTAYVVVNYDEPNAGFGVYGEGAVIFMFGKAFPSYGMENFAYESNVMFHEFGHYILYDLTDFDDSYVGNPYFGAVEEGWSDFWAASGSGHPVIGEYIWDGAGYYQRDVQENRSLPDDFSSGADSHENGRIVGSMLWDVMSAIGQSNLEIILFDAMTNVEGSNDDMDLIVSGLLKRDRYALDAKFGACILDRVLLHGLKPAAGMDESYPEVTASAWQAGVTGGPVALEAEASDDDEITSWWWNLDSTPEGSLAQILDPWSAQTSLYVDVPGDYIVSVVAMDEDWGLSEVETLNFTVSAEAGKESACSHSRGGTWLAGFGAVVGLLTLRRRGRP